MQLLTEPGHAQVIKSQLSHVIISNLPRSLTLCKSLYVKSLHFDTPMTILILAAE